jgi:enoyl-CoA hydratase
MGSDYSRMQHLEVVQEGRLLSVSLNRPDSLNAINAALHRELEDIWPMISVDESVGAVLLRGNGRSFCAGGDVKVMADAASGSGPDTGMSDAVGRTTTLLDMPRRLIENQLALRQPLVCAVHGYAMGLGASMALCADIVIAAEDAAFGDAHVTIGLVPADGGTLMWPLLLPLNTAKYYLMTGERMSGAEAHRLGLVQRVVTAGELDAAAAALARQLADGPTLALALTKSVLNKVVRERANLMLDTSLLMEAVTMSSSDHAEASRSFTERRPPQYTGR